MLVVKRNLVRCGIVISGEVPVYGGVCEDLGANASPKIGSVSVIYSASYAYVRVTCVCVPTTVVQP